MTVGLSYIRRDLKSAGGVTVSAGNYSTSLPAYKSQSLAALQEQNPCADHQEWVWTDRTAAWSSTKIVLADATFDLVPAAALHVDSHHHLASGISIRELRPHVRKVLRTLGYARGLDQHSRGVLR